MNLASNGIIPPNHWYHKPELQNNNGWTVAMLIGYKCKQIPPQQWEHNPTLVNDNSWTVAMNLAYNKIIPPK